MAYKIKKKNYSDIEGEELFKYAKHQKPSFLQVLREADRDVVKIPKLLHTKGTSILYKENLGTIKKVTPKGVWIEYFEYDVEKGLIEDYKKKKKFITEKEIYEGKIYPTSVAHQPVFFAGVPITAKP